MKESISHTPAPWRVVQIGSDTFVSADGETICDMLRNDCEDEEEIARCDANARLIAQSPILLACLKTAEQEIRLSAVIHEHDERSETATELRSRAAIYAQAIAKAKGKP